MPGAERRPRARLRGRERDHLPVGGAVRAAARGFAPSGLAAARDARDLLADDPHRAVDERRLDHAAHARAVTLGDRGEDADAPDERRDRRREHEVGRGRDVDPAMSARMPE